MKISREYILGVGSGLVLSAILSLVLSAGLSSIIPQSLAVSNADKAIPQISQGNTGTNKPASAAESVIPAGQLQGAIPGNQSLGQPQGSLSGQAGTVQPSASSAVPGEGVFSSTQKPPGDQSTNGSASGKPANNPANSPDTGRRFVIPSGASAEKIADLLVAQGFVADKEQFLEIVDKREAAARFRAGTYSLPGSLTPDEIVTKLLTSPVR